MLKKQDRILSEGPMQPPPTQHFCTYEKHIDVVFASKSWRCEEGGGGDETFHQKTHSTGRGTWVKTYLETKTICGNTAVLSREANNTSLHMHTDTSVQYYDFQNTHMIHFLNPQDIGEIN